MQGPTKKQACHACKGFLLGIISGIRFGKTEAWPLHEKAQGAAGCIARGHNSGGIKSRRRIATRSS